MGRCQEFYQQKASAPVVDNTSDLDDGERQEIMIDDVGEERILMH
jgi:hypothetical protein